jgi:hypothetical protein
MPWSGWPRQHPDIPARPAGDRDGAAAPTPLQGAQSQLPSQWRLFSTEEFRVCGSFADAIWMAASFNVDVREGRETTRYVHKCTIMACCGCSRRNSPWSGRRHIQDSYWRAVSSGRPMRYPRHPTKTSGWSAASWQTSSASRSCFGAGSRTTRPSLSAGSAHTGRAIWRTGSVRCERRCRVAQSHTARRPCRSVCWSPREGRRVLDM